MRRVAVIGVGVTKFGQHERTSAELFAEAARCADRRRLPASAVQALYYGNVVGGETEKQLHTGPQAASVLGIPTVPPRGSRPRAPRPRRIPPRGDGDRPGGLGRRPGRRRRAGAERDDRAESTEYFAYASDAALGADARPHLPRRLRPGRAGPHGQVRDHRGADGRVAVKNHRHGAAQSQGAVPEGDHVEQVIKSPMSPIRSSSTIAARSPTAGRRCPGLREGGAQASAGRLGARVACRLRHDVHRPKSGISPGWPPPSARRRAPTCRRARPEDVDVVELHDCFTIAEIVATEGLGLFEPGTGGIAAEKGWTSIGGKIPVNPSGGLKAKGHPIGRHRRRPDRRDRHPAPRGCRAAPGRRRPRRAHPHPRRQHRHRARLPVRP